MDLLATVRKEGSRGGRGDFKWSDVQTSSHRENYLGHSLMAPVGRWQKGRDLNWYAKGESDAKDDEDPAARAARERKEEIRRVKEAEEDAMARALGLPVAPRDNPNLETLGTQREVGNVLKEAAEEDASASRGVGYGRLTGVTTQNEGQSITECLEGTGTTQDKELQYALKEYKRRHGDRKHRSRSRRMTIIAVEITIRGHHGEGDLYAIGHNRRPMAVTEIGYRVPGPEVDRQLTGATETTSMIEKDEMVPIRDGES
ncbi:hypothetical protein H2200_012149 [Cladophialophora chaetospira]|uniref:Multiple myeloma tumor-associated protein 2-like N-terminal domain-containing protein n=1 Tax=Cladophialophora chaetospira TaxID=386627 RepID=A0AA38WY93_9EURO|nr:hypothetical protein H2200_012149 [Cladophialophora chaetospira]